MPSTKFKSLKRQVTVSKFRRSCILILAILTVFTGLYFAQKTSAKIIATKLPEVAKIYDAEVAQFPGYNVSTFKNWTSTSNGTQVSYVVGLQAQHQATGEEMRQAGKTACATGLPEGTIVTVSARKQYWILPFYTAYNLSGICPKAQ